MYSFDIRDVCKRMVKKIVAAMKKDKEAYPNAMELVEGLRAITTQAKGSYRDIEDKNAEQFSRKPWEQLS